MFKKDIIKKNKMPPKKNNKWIWICLILLFIIIFNELTETIAHNLSKKDNDLTKSFSVFCYNVKCSDINYETNQKHIAYEILNEKPDIVFLCEFNLSVSRKLDSIISSCNQYKRYYRSKANCIFYSKFEIDTIFGINTKTSEGRRALNNMIHVYLPSDTITIVGCHLSSSRKALIKGYKNRTIEADSIYKCIANETNPLIVMGDMNDVSSSYTIQRIREANLKDAWWEGGCGYGSTFHMGLFRLRIDYILYQNSKLLLKEVKTLKTDFSDHNAVKASFEIL